MTTPAPTEPAQLEETIARVKAASPAFARLSIDDRVRLVEELREGYHKIAEASAIAACVAKGIDPQSPLAGEEWLAGPMTTLRNLRLTAEGLREVKRFGAPRLDRSAMRTLPDGRLVVKVYPPNALDGVLLAKHLGEVYMQPGVTAENVSEHQARFYKKPHDGKLCAVLGAGNVNAIPPTDCLYKMFVEGDTVVLKMNPVNAYLGPLLEQAFQAAITRGFFAVVYGGAEVGGALVNHRLVDEVHITGSDKTHDFIVWGPPGPEADARKARNEPLLKKVITSELGNITPVLLVPGPWSDDELEFQALDVAGMVTNNASFNCTAAKLLVTPRTDERRRFLELLARALAKAPPRAAYYPGAEVRWKQFTDDRPGLQLVGHAGPGELPWAIIPDVDLSKTGDRVFSQEPWCAVLSEVSPAATDPAAFLEEAVKLCNEGVWGTLAATLLVHPKTLKDPVLGQAVEKAIRDLRYGSVCVNTWAGATFALGQTPWGPHPSSSLQNIQSGRGFVHNSYMLEDIEKCVLRAPAKAFPISPWFPGHRTVDVLAKRLCELEVEPSWLKVPGIAAAAMRG